MDSGIHPLSFRPRTMRKMFNLSSPHPLSRTLSSIRSNWILVSVPVPDSRSASSSALSCVSFWTQSPLPCYSFTTSELFSRIRATHSDSQIFRRIFSISSTETHPFILMALAWSASLCSLKSQTPSSFKNASIPLLYLLAVGLLLI